MYNLTLFFSVPENVSQSISIEYEQFLIPTTATKSWLRNKLEQLLVFFYYYYYINCVD